MFRTNKKKEQMMKTNKKQCRRSDTKKDDIHFDVSAQYCILGQSKITSHICIISYPKPSQIANYYFDNKREKKKTPVRFNEKRSWPLLEKELI